MLGSGTYIVGNRSCMPYLQWTRVSNTSTSTVKVETKLTKVTITELDMMVLRRVYCTVAALVGLALWIIGTSRD